MMRSLFILLLVIFISGCSAPKEKGTLEDTTATELVNHIESFKGEKPVLVNFWATWCIPCIEEFPYIMELKEKYDDEFELIFVSGDFEDDKEDARNFLKEQNVQFTTYYKTGKDDEFIRTVSDTWSGALPYTMIISKDGTVLTSWEGKAEFEHFESELLKVINEG